jgi:hypothetical protein
VKAVNVDKLIRVLYAERAILDRAIASLEAVRAENELGATQAFRLPGRRGRKSMSKEERHEVSERMKRYWAQRREEDTRSLGRRMD